MTSFSTSEVRLLGEVVNGLAHCRAPHLFDDQPLASSMLRLFGADFLGTTHWDARQRRYVEPRCHNRDDVMSVRYRDHFQYVDPISPLMRRRRRPTSIYEVITRSQLSRTEYYADFLLPNRVADGVDLYLYDGGQVVGDFRVWRRPGAARLGDREIELLTLLRPYLLNHLRLREARSVDASVALSATVDARRGRIQLSEPLARLVEACAPDERTPMLDRIKQLVRAPDSRATLLDHRIAFESVEDTTGRGLTVHLVDHAATSSAPSRLSPTVREQHVLELIGRGLSDKAIARRLGISYWTVRTHVTHLMRKAQVGRRGELAFAALRLTDGAAPRLGQPDTES